MKIAFVINDITGLGGAERVVTLAANYFSVVEEFEVEIVSVFPKKNETIGFNLKNSVHVSYLFPEQILGKTIKKTKQALRELRNFYKKRNFDFIICCSTSLSVLSKISIVNSSSSHSKIISWEHTQHSHLSKNINRVQRVCYPFLDGIVTLTSYDKSIFSKFCKNVAYIPNISTFKEVEYNNLQSKKVIAVGRLNHAKGFDLLIKSFKIVHEKHPEWQLDVFGEGELLDVLDTQIRNLGLEQVIKMKGYESDILKQYTNCSIFALSSRTEGFPCVLVEAMSSGLATVSYELPGFREVIEHNKNGLLVSSGDIVNFANAIICLIEQESLRVKIGINAKEAVKQFQSENIIPKWVKLFKEISKNKTLGNKNDKCNNNNV